MRPTEPQRCVSRPKLRPKSVGRDCDVSVTVSCVTTLIVATPLLLLSLRTVEPPRRGPVAGSSHVVLVPGPRCVRAAACTTWWCSCGRRSTLSDCPPVSRTCCANFAPMSGQFTTYTHAHSALCPGLPGRAGTSLDFTEARDSEWQWHQLGHMQVCTSLQTDNHTSTPPLSFVQVGCPSCRPTSSVKALKAASQIRHKDDTPANSSPCLSVPQCTARWLSPGVTLAFVVLFTEFFR